MKKILSTLLLATAGTLLIAQSTQVNLPVGFDRANQGLENTSEPATPVILPKEASSSRMLSFNEDFDDITLLPGLGWAFINNSSPLGLTGWFQGNPGVFNAHAGPENSYIGANYNNTSGVGTISNWLITPELVMNDGDVVKFWSRSIAQNFFPDNLQLRLSISGASTNVGTLATDVGDFTTLLLEINPGININVYPEVWTEYSVTLSGLGNNVAGRLAFRYFVTNAGISGDNSNYIGIDSFSYEAAESPAVPLSDYALYFGILLIAVYTFIRLRRIV